MWLLFVYLISVFYIALFKPLIYKQTLDKKWKSNKQSVLHFEFFDKIHCITLYYAQQEISWKLGKTSKFGPIHSTIQIWTDFHENEAKKKIVLKKNIQHGRFSKLPILEIFLQKFHRSVLWLVGLIDAKAINLAQPIWLWGCLTYGQKQVKNAFLCF